MEPRFDLILSKAKTVTDPYALLTVLGLATRRSLSLSVWKASAEFHAFSEERSLISPVASLAACSSHLNRSKLDREMIHNVFLFCT